MSLTADVAEEVVRRGRATVDDLLRALPGNTRKALQKALQNAKQLGKVRVAVRGGSRTPSVWAPPVLHDLIPKRKPKERPVRSVWDLAHPLNAEPWPPQFEGGRVHILHDEVEAASIERNAT